MTRGGDRWGGQVGERTDPGGHNQNYKGVGESLCFRGYGREAQTINNAYWFTNWWTLETTLTGESDRIGLGIYADKLSEVNALPIHGQIVLIEAIRSSLSSGIARVVSIG